MRLLVLGGSVFLSRAVAADAVARGHQVVCACRGTSGGVPEGTELVEVDRSTGPFPDLGAFDAVVDVARTPSWVRAAVAALRTSSASAHWVFVSTVNVYADDATPLGTPRTLPLRPPLDDSRLDDSGLDDSGLDDSRLDDSRLDDSRLDDSRLDDDPAAYGRMKVACEQLVLGGVSSAMVVRPGLIVGPGDPSGRFAYWPRRLSRVGESPEVLAPGDPADLMQVIDVRDLAAWIVTACEQRLTGVFDGIGPAVPIAELLLEVAAGAGAVPSWTWLPQDFLAGQGVQPWSGPESIPLWLPRPEYDGLPAHDARHALDAGLTIRPLADTTRDTLAWLDADPDAPVGGIDLDRERALLAVWPVG